MAAPLNGGSAFPMYEPAANGYGGSAEYGMSLRDYFAAMAMQGLAAAPNVRDTQEGIAKVSYQMADAMLAERAK